MNRPPLLLSRYLSCISCINHVYIYIFWPILTESHYIIHHYSSSTVYLFIKTMLCLRSRYSLSFVYCHHYHHYCHSNIIFGTSSSKSYFYRGGKSIRERERETEFSIRANETDPDGVSLRTRYTVKSCWRNSIGQTILEISAEFSTFSLSCFFRPIFSFHARFDNWSARYRPYTSDGK